MYVIFISFTRFSPPPPIPLQVNGPDSGSFRLQDLSDYAHVYKLSVIYYFMEFLLVFVVFVCVSIPGMGLSSHGRFISYAVWCTNSVNY